MSTLPIKTWHQLSFSMWCDNSICLDSCEKHAQIQEPTVRGNQITIVRNNSRSSPSKTISATSASTDTQYLHYIRFSLDLDLDLLRDLESLLPYIYLPLTWRPSSFISPLLSLMISFILSFKSKVVMISSKTMVSQL